MNTNLLYIKVEQNIEVLNRQVYLEDVAKLYSVDKNMVHQLGRIRIFDIESKKEYKYTFSVMRIIEQISELYPETLIINLGEEDFVVEYKIPSKIKKVFEYCKTFLVALMIFAGAAFAIMTFNTDVSVDKVFDNIYLLIMGEEKAIGSILEISYSIGIPIGIIIFFNHFSKIKVQDDPTPMQIEMRLYEEELNKALIQDATREGKVIDSN